MARQVWVYGATVTHRILWVSSTVSEVFLFLRKTNFFLRNFKKVNQCKKVRAFIDTSHGRTCRQNHASYSAPGSP